MSTLSIECYDVYFCTGNLSSEVQPEKSEMSWNREAHLCDSHICAPLFQDWDILAEVQLEAGVEAPAAIAWRGDGKHFATLSRQHAGGEHLARMLLLS